MSTEYEYLRQWEDSKHREEFGHVDRYEPEPRLPDAPDALGSFYDPLRDRITATARVSGPRGGATCPWLMLAGPRDTLWKDPASIRAAVLTGGGVAPGLNRVIHSIVKRHYDVYKLNEDEGGIVFGIRDGFGGLSRGPDGVRALKLTPGLTEKWADRGGTMLGSVREKNPRTRTWQKVLKHLETHILYVVGGNGSLTAANKLFKTVYRSKDPGDRIVIAGIPKTMDNDILWTDRSFGFQSTVDEAAHVIRALKEDAHATRRLCIIGLFGRSCGFVAAAASLASGCVDAVLVPEECQTGSFDADGFGAHLRKRLAERKKTGEDHAVVVVAQGARFGSRDPEEELEWLRDEVIGKHMRKRDLPTGGIFTNEPRHLIRAIPPNPNDQIYCERLADLAVDNALAGFTGFVVTRWMSHFVVVPLRHVARQTKTLEINGLLWRQVLNATGQPPFSKAGRRPRA